MSALSEIHAPALSEEQGIGALTLPGFVTEVSETHAHREALYWRDLDGVDRRWSYSEFYEESRKVAKALLAHGVGKDTRVGVLMSNRPEWIFSVFGAAMAGAVTALLNTFSTQRELRHQLEITGVELLIMEAGVASKDFVEDMISLCPVLAATEPGRLLMDELPFLRRVVCVDTTPTPKGFQDWGAFLDHGEAFPDAVLLAASESCSPVDDALIFFSSGSTAEPKAIRQTHRAATLQCWRASRWYELDGDVRTWTANGFFWSGNFMMALGNTFGVGGCLVLQRYFEPEETLRLLERERVSYAFAWPHQEAQLKESSSWNEVDLSSLIYVDAQGLFATHPTVNATWRQPSGYGLTETFTFVSGFSGRENTDKSCGPVLQGNSVRIVHPDTGAILPVGEIGEIITKGPTLTRGYLNIPPEETFDKEGYIHTADAGYFGANGHLFWEGRLGDIIKTGGANVSPTEIDAVIMNHGAVMSVFTIGLPHKSLGEIVVSCVVRKDGHDLDEDGVREFAKQSLASYKVPRRVLFLSEEELPMTGSSKIQRPELRKLAATRLGQAV